MQANDRPGHLHHYIIGEKLRSGSAEAQAALSRQGRYKDVAGNLRVKEVRIAEDERFVICFNRSRRTRRRNPSAASRSAGGDDHRQRRPDQGQARRVARAISTKPGLYLYLRTTPGGLLRVDATKIKAEENLDGNYLLRTSDLKLAAEDIATGYKQLLQVERG